jgi:hypothetical protein
MCLILNREQFWILYVESIAGIVDIMDHIGDCVEGRAIASHFKSSFEAHPQLQPNQWGGGSYPMLATTREMRWSCRMKRWSCIMKRWSCQISRTTGCVNNVPLNEGT